MVTINPASSLASVEPRFAVRQLHGRLSIAVQPVLAVEGNAGRVIVRFDVLYARGTVKVWTGDAVRTATVGDSYYMGLHVTAPAP